MKKLASILLALTIIVTQSGIAQAGECLAVRAARDSLLEVPDAALLLLPSKLHPTVEAREKMLKALLENGQMVFLDFWKKCEIQQTSIRQSALGHFVKEGLATIDAHGNYCITEKGRVEAGYPYSFYILSEKYQRTLLRRAIILSFLQSYGGFENAKILADELTANGIPCEHKSIHEDLQYLKGKGLIGSLEENFRLKPEGLKCIGMARMIWQDHGAEIFGADEAVLFLATEGLDEIIDGAMTYEEQLVRVLEGAGVRVDMTEGTPPPTHLEPELLIESLAEEEFSVLAPRAAGQGGIPERYMVFIDSHEEAYWLIKKAINKWKLFKKDEAVCVTADMHEDKQIWNTPAMIEPFDGDWLWWNLKGNDIKANLWIRPAWDFLAYLWLPLIGLFYFIGRYLFKVSIFPRYIIPGLMKEIKINGPVVLSIDYDYFSFSVNREDIAVIHTHKATLEEICQKVVELRKWVERNNLDVRLIIPCRSHGYVPEGDIPIIEAALKIVFSDYEFESEPETVSVPNEALFPETERAI